MKLAILGFGREGRSVFRFLKKRNRLGEKPRAEKDEIWILDRNENIKIPKAARANLGENYLKNLSSFDVIFRSPGIPYTLSNLYRARCRGVRVSSATKLFFDQLAGGRKAASARTPRVIGVTGTKGKSTTSTLVAEILRKSGLKTVLAGNIGKPMLDLLGQAKKADFIVLELSSFQLQDLPVSPEVAVVLDVFPDHLDEHKSLREYYGSKANIGRFQKKTDAIFYFGDNPVSKAIAKKSPAAKIPVFPKDDGPRKNYEMASAVAGFLKCPEKVIEKTIASFRGLEHRLEPVRKIKNGFPKGGAISFYNDSASTNPEAAAFAVRAFNNPVILIAGGRDKGLDYAPLGRAIQNRKNVKAAVLFGENKDKIERVIKKTESGALIARSAKNLEAAVKTACALARKLIASGGEAAVLFSPGSASFDMFRNYAERGRAFKKIVRRLK